MGVIKMENNSFEQSRMEIMREAKAKFCEL
jgi:hypothetical protein